MDQPMNRRQLLTAAAAATAAACLGCLCDPAELLAQTTLPTTLPTSQPTILDVGTLADYPADGISKKFLKHNKVAVIRHEGHLYACTAICTHRGGTLKTPDGLTFKCPRHGATFDINGDVTGGPAQFPLNRFAITLGDDGHITVDKTKIFPPEKWTDPASFIKIS
jgi:Rieske Fe-S protein